MIIQKGNLIDYEDTSLNRMVGSYSDINGHLQIMMTGFEISNDDVSRFMKTHTMNYEVIFSFNTRGL